MLCQKLKCNKEGTVCGIDDGLWSIINSIRSSFLPISCFISEDGGSTFFWGTSGLLPHHVALHPGLMFIITTVRTSNPVSLFFTGLCSYHNHLLPPTWDPQLSAYYFTIWKNTWLTIRLNCQDLYKAVQHVHSHNSDSPYYSGLDLHLSLLVILWASA